MKVCVYLSTHMRFRVRSHGQWRGAERAVTSLTTWSIARIGSNRRSKSLWSFFFKKGTVPSTEKMDDEINCYEVFRSVAFTTSRACCDSHFLPAENNLAGAFCSYPVLNGAVGLVWLFVSRLRCALYIAVTVSRVFFFCVLFFRMIAF